VLEALAEVPGEVQVPVPEAPVEVPGEAQEPLVEVPVEVQEPVPVVLAEVPVKAQEPVPGAWRVRARGLVPVSPDNPVPVPVLTES